MKKKAGYIMILLGIFIPLAILPITSGFDAPNGLITNFLNAQIVIRKPMAEKSEKIDQAKPHMAKPKWLSDGGIAIPYRFPLAFSIAFIFLGILAIDQSKIKDQ
jgi:hypothetical protein